MRYKGKIKKLNHIVVSDPYYNKGVLCRYEIENLNEKDWIVNLDIIRKKEKIEEFDISYTDFFMLIKKEDNLCNLIKDGISYLNDINLKEYRIGMDTACVALGINDNAKEIINSQDEWQPSCSIRTGTDGFFGEVKEGKDKNNNLCFVYIYGSIDDDMDYELDDIKDYLVKQFEITELEIESKSSKNEVENAISVEEG